MKSEREDGESKEEKHGKYKLKQGNQRKSKDDMRGREGGRGPVTSRDM